MMASCWTWDVDPVLIPIAGPIQIRWYGLAFLGVFYVGWKLLDWQMRRAGRGPENASRFVNWSVVGVLLGAWFGHRLFYEWDEVARNPLYLIDVRKGISGLASHGATLGVILTIIVYSRKYRIPMGEMFDRFMWAAANSAVFVRLGNFFNSEVVGKPSDVPWAVCLPRFDAQHPQFDAAHHALPIVPIPRHPTQLYEVLIGLGVLAILTLVDRLAGMEKRPRWLMTGVYFTTYFTARFFVEMLKEQQGGIAGTWQITTGALLSIPFAAGGIFLILYALKTRQPASEGVSLLDVVPPAPARNTASKSK
jgi:phosphatidylglycerol:prolipoprotein diacylglycerol transferase